MPRDAKELAQLLEGLTPEQRELLEKLGEANKPPPRERRIPLEEAETVRMDLGIDELEARIDVLEARIDVLERHARGEGDVPQPRPAKPAKTDDTEPPR